MRTARMGSTAMTVSLVLTAGTAGKRRARRAWPSWSQGTSRFMPTVSPTFWAARELDFHAANLKTETAKRLRLTSGIVPRFQLSPPYAFFANMTADGDFGILVDTDPASPTVHEVVARIPLATLADGPKPGVSTAGTQARLGDHTRWPMGFRQPRRRRQGSTCRCQTAASARAAPAVERTPLADPRLS